MHPGVVADVDDCGQLVIAGQRRAGGELAKIEQLLHPEQEAGAADSADQDRDLHTARQYAGKTRGNGSVGGCDRHAMAAKHRCRKKMITRWYGNLANRLQSASYPCVITAVSFRLAGRIRCRRPRFDHLFESRWPHIKTVVTFTINETR